METNFKYYNPSPIAKVPKSNGKYPRWDRGDCSIRSICGATGMNWVDAYRFAFESSLKVCDLPSFGPGFAQIMKDLGFEKISYPRGQKRETVDAFAKNPAHKKEICILNLAGHYVCVRDGKYMDVWDCGQCTAYNYWVKK